MEFLEHSIDAYLKNVYRTLDFGQICIGMLRCLEAFHQRGYIHRDVKPENFRVHNDKVYLIDFGMYREYKTKEGKHIPYAAGKQFRGTPMTSSIFTHQSSEPSRRDDLISMVYSALYIHEQGDLPWLKDCDEYT